MSAAGYAPALMVPGYEDLARMAAVLLAERARVPETQVPEMLVLGAGGGNELAAMAALHKEWRFTGVDPSADMLAQARAKVAADAGRMSLILGKIEAAPMGPYDGAVCLLTLHFLPRDERLETLRALHARLRKGAALVVAHHSIAAGALGIWLPRFAAFAAQNGVTGPGLADGARALGAALPIMDPADEEELLRMAGFGDVQMFYAALSFRGWVAVA